MNVTASLLANHAVATAWAVLAAGLVAYLFHINRLLSGTPDEIAQLVQERWTPELLRETYARLEKHPINTESYRHRLPPRLDRRYVVVGGSGKWRPTSTANSSG